jgi:hypothetical protein
LQWFKLIVCTLYEVDSERSRKRPYQMWEIEWQMISSWCEAGLTRDVRPNNSRNNQPGRSDLLQEKMTIRNKWFDLRRCDYCFFQSVDIGDRLHRSFLWPVNSCLMSHSDLTIPVGTNLVS